MEIPTAVDWSNWPTLAPQLDHEVEEWQQDYRNNVEPILWEEFAPQHQHQQTNLLTDLFDDPFFGGIHVIP